MKTNFDYRVALFHFAAPFISFHLFFLPFLSQAIDRSARKDLFKKISVEFYYCIHPFLKDSTTRFSFLLIKEELIYKAKAFCRSKSYKQRNTYPLYNPSEAN